jgi:rhamnogalacturonyl hydrolase YesR
MDRRRFLQRSALAGLSGSALTAAWATDSPSNAVPAQPAPADANAARLAKVRLAALALQRRDWEQGTLAQAFLEAGDMQQVILFSKAALLLKVPDGRMAVVGEGSPTDPAMGGEAYWRAGQVTRDTALQHAVEDMLQWLLQRAPRAPDGTLYHVFQRPEVWADGFNGAPPFLAATGHYDEALRQIDGFKRRLWIPEKKLLAHIASDDKKAQPPQPEFFGTGNGWAATGLARVIRALPSSREADRNRLAQFVRDIADGCLAYQRPDGLFHNLVDRPDTFVETNLAQMLAFALYIGVKGEWLPASYLEHAHRMRKAAIAKVDSFGFVQEVCSAPGFDSPGISTEGQAFHLMMEAAAAKLQ